MINYTTTIKAEKTVGEIQAILAKFGATRIVLDYERSNVASISFQIMHRGMALVFILPANSRGVHKALNKKRIESKYKKEEHAYNVSWRIIKIWIEGQLALVESEQADLATVMLPYSVMQNGKTVSENLL